MYRDSLREIVCQKLHVCHILRHLVYHVEKLNFLFFFSLPRFWHGFPFSFLLSMPWILFRLNFAYPFLKEEKTQPRGGGVKVRTRHFPSCLVPPPPRCLLALALLLIAFPKKFPPFSSLVKFLSELIRSKRGGAESSSHGFI